LTVIKVQRAGQVILLIHLAFAQVDHQERIVAQCGFQTIGFNDERQIDRIHSRLLAGDGFDDEWKADRIHSHFLGTMASPAIAR
jgi:hypothetical protein